MKHIPVKGLLTVALMALVASVLTGCKELHGPQSVLVTNGPVAQAQLDTFMVTFYVTLFIFVLVGGALLYSVATFRDKGQGDDALPPQTHGRTSLELGLAAVSCLLLVIIAVPTLKNIFYADTVPRENAASALKIRVTGFQWWWRFEYLEEKLVTANELVIPTGRPISFVLDSGDVIHSFWVPRLAGKVDCMPGQENHMWFMADTPGLYYGQCTEFCGESHAFMRFRCRALEPKEFEKWLADMRTPPPPVAADLQEGQRITIDKCGACHNINGTIAAGIMGPDLTLFGRRATVGAGVWENSDEWLTKWIDEPDAMKPGTKMPDLNLSPQEIAHVVRYLRSLK